MNVLLSLGFFAFAGVWGSIFFYRRDAGGNWAPLWLMGWLALSLIGAKAIQLPTVFVIFCAGVAAGFGGGWRISRLRSRLARIALLLGWIALPIAAFLALFWPGPGSEMFGFAVILFGPILFSWAVATLLGATLSPRSGPQS